MSAIAAAVLTTSTRAPAITQSIIDEMPHRAPDGRDFWSDNACVLGFGFMRTAPESRVSGSIFHSNELAVAGDVRLDNRDELISSLGLTLGETPSDLRLVGECYARWGESFASRLLGDFAFFLWDRSKQQLLAVRDHMGVRPLFYRYGPEGLLACSEIKPLLDPGEPFSDLRAKGPRAKFLADFIGNKQPDDHSLIYEGVSRLPGGHILIYVQGQPPSLRAYWQASPLPGVLPTRSAPLPAVFRKLFTEAVECRLTRDLPQAALLSGGLDSTAIAYTAADILQAAGQPALPTLSGVFNKVRRWNENKYILTAARNPNIEATLLPMDDHAPLGSLDKFLDHFGGLNFAPGMKMSIMLMQQLKRMGIRTYLDGHGGDEVVSHGFGRLFELATQRRWIKVWLELRSYSKLYGSSRIFAFLLLLSKYGRMKGIYQLRRALKFWADRSHQGEPDVLGPKLKQEIADAVPALRPEPLASTEVAQHQAVLRSVNLVASLETLELTAALLGLEVRFPFFDKRLIEFCLSLPSEEKLDHGHIRLILRRAMEGVLPPSIQWRASKFDFTPHIADGIIRQHADLIESLINQDANILGQYMNLWQIRKDFEYIRRAHFRAKGGAVQRVWKAAVLASWLGQTSLATTGKNA